MSKKVTENPNISQKGDYNTPISDTFSFLELNQFFSQDNNKQEIKEKSNKKIIEKKESEKKHKLKIKPKADIAREQTSDDLMYIENEDNFLKEESDKEEEKKEKIEEKKEEMNKEKNAKKIIDKKKIDKKNMKLNLEKEKNEEKLNKKDNSESKNKNKNPDEYNIESIINKIKDKDPQAYTPIILPFEKDNNENKSLKDDLNENSDNNKLFILQFPRQIPIKEINNQIKLKEEENVNEEPNYDENGFLISPEFTNSFQEIQNNTVIGKLVIMKSGKIKIKMGDIYFDINQGSTTKFAQYSAIVTGDNDDNQAYILGQPLSKKLIVTPEFD